MGEEKYYLAVILAQAIYAGMVLLTKATFNGGMNCYIFTFYHQLVGTVVLVPLAMVFERRNGTPLSVVTFGKIFMLAFLGVTLPLNASNVALAYTLATFGAAILNCLPVATFFLALLLRMEKLNIRTTAGIVKVAGLGACMAGIVVLTFCLVFVPCSSERLRFTTLLCLSSTGQCFVFAIALERDPSEWKLSWNIKLLTIVYTQIDLVTEVELEILTKIIKHINGMAQMKQAKFGFVDMDFVLGVGGYDLDRIDSEVQLIFKDSVTRP
ncbi:WAT1-related protein At5g64700-like [Humulus lupulus]|uniref:WAT1-related protein At5g64700-like n=1 Tax=Humulus lupulus TaxID=3486 RepID=UPI002B4166BC|nr:WAT1-related protein At5g64700-like [Humulus lupulus]